jgi:hypothetical protein
MEYLFGSCFPTYYRLWHNKDGNLKYNVFRSFDIDETCADAADSLNRDPYVIEGWKFKATTSNIFEINYFK